MTVSISRMDINYYLSTIAAHDGAYPQSQLTGYYTDSGDPQGAWFGDGLNGLGMVSEQIVTKQAAVALYEEAKNPRTGKPLGKRPMKDTQAPEGAKTASGKSAKGTRKAVSGFDLTFSVPKSVSALWAIADNGTQARIHRAHQDAVRKVLTYAQDNLIQTRAGNGGVVKVATKGIIASLFDHFDSRMGDPQLHTHAVLANRVQRASDGSWVTLDSYALHKSVVTLSEMYNAVLFDELAQTVAAEAEQRDPLMAVLKKKEEPERNRRMELAGVPDDLIAEFSQRTVSIEMRKEELIREWELNYGERPSEETIIKLREKATLETREEKAVDKEPLQQRLHHWRIRAIRKGHFPETIVANATGRTISFYSPDDFTEQARKELAIEVLDRTVPKHPTFTRANLLASTHRLTANLRFKTIEERDTFAQEITDLALTQTIELTPDRYDLDHLTQEGLSLRGTSVFDRAEEKKYTTAQVLDQETELMAAAQTKTSTHLENAQQALADLTVHTSEQGHHLAPDQLQAAYEVITSNRALSAIIGPAGTGKTSTLAGLRTAWEAQQGKGSIIGLAPSAAAAAVLGKELGISTDNTAKWLYESVGEGAMRRASTYADLKEKIATYQSRLKGDPRNRATLAGLDAARTQLATTIAAQSKYQLKPGQLLIVDEASMSSTTDLYQLHKQAEEVGAKVLLVGDPRQLDAVDAGGYLGWLENNDLSSNLTSVWRFKNDWEKEASLRLRVGDTDVLDLYKEHGRITEAEDILDSAYKAWRADTLAGKTSVLIAGRNDQVKELNERAQKDRMDNGEIGLTLRMPISTGHAYLGDTIITRLNKRQLIDSAGDFIKNGTRLKVTHISTNHLEAVREDTGATISIPRDYAQEAVELGYACTIHRSQGLTVDTGHVAVSEDYNREQLYVAMTRGKQNNQIHISTTGTSEPAESPDNWGVFTAIVPEDSMQLLTSIMNKSDTDKTAHEILNAEHGWANNLARTINELDYLKELIATRKAHEFIQEFLGIDPAEYADTPEMKALVLAAKDAPVDLGVLTGINPEITTIQGATQLLQDMRYEETDTELFPEAHLLTDDEKQAQEAIRARINERVETIEANNAEQPWVREMRAKYPVEKNTHREIIIWRALSGQEDEEKMLGQAPRSDEKRLTRYWDTLQAVLENHDEKIVEELLYQPDLDNPAYDLDYALNTDLEEDFEVSFMDDPSFNLHPNKWDAPDAGYIQ